MCGGTVPVYIMHIEQIRNIGMEQIGHKIKENQATHMFRYRYIYTYHIMYIQINSIYLYIYIKYILGQQVLSRIFLFYCVHYSKMPLAIIALLLLYGGQHATLPATNQFLLLLLLFFGAVAVAVSNPN